MIKDLINVFRPIRWYRNGFMVLGTILALKIIGIHPLQFFTPQFLYPFFISFISICLISSGNYGINEVLDAETDKHHPVKKNRAVASGRVSKKIVIAISLILYLLGFIMAASLNNYMLFFSVGLLFISGILYNIKPFRLKDRPYLDFTFEALNNPIRLLIGWYAIAAPIHIVPTSFILGYWFLGIFLMAAKRFGEIRFIKDEIKAANYRKSLHYYTEEKILFAMIGSLVAFSFMLGSLCMKYSVDLILILPLIIIWSIWFFHLAYQENSIVKDPERVFEEKPFAFFSLITAIIFIYLLFSGNQLFSWIK